MRSAYFSFQHNLATKPHLRNFPLPNLHHHRAERDALPHGDVELLDVEGKNVYVRLSGACTGCQLASATLSGIQQRLIEDLGEFVKVIPVTENSRVQISGV